MVPLVDLVKPSELVAKGTDDDCDRRWVINRPLNLKRAVRGRGWKASRSPWHSRSRTSAHLASTAMVNLLHVGSGTNVSANGVGDGGRGVCVGRDALHARVASRRIMIQGFPMVCVSSAAVAFLSRPSVVLGECGVLPVLSQGVVIVLSE